MTEDYSRLPMAHRGAGQSREERKAAEEARIAREKLLREAGQYLSDDDLRQIIAEGEKRA
jgi:hypothetical protein